MVEEFECFAYATHVHQQTQRCSKFLLWFPECRQSLLWFILIVFYLNSVNDRNTTTPFGCSQLSPYEMIRSFAEAWQMTSPLSVLDSQQGHQQDSQVGNLICD